MHFVERDVRDVDLRRLVIELGLQLEETLLDVLLDVGGQLLLCADELWVERVS